MAKFDFQLPSDIMQEIEKISKSSDEIFGGMTRAGAEVVRSTIVSTVPQAIKSSNMMKCLKVTKTYETPSDGGINTKVGFYGYFVDKEGKTKPAPLVGNVFEYGRSNAPFPKQPFMRKAFKKKEIEQAMLKAQAELSGGIL